MLKVSTKVILDTRKARKDGTYTAKLRITYNYKQKYYSLNASYTKEKWERITDPKCKGKNQELANFYNTIEMKARETIQDLHPFTLTLFEQKFFQRTTKKNEILPAIFDLYHNIRKEGRIGTSLNFKTSYNNFHRFLKEINKTKITFEEVTTELIIKYDKWLVNNQISATTIAIYMKPISFILNRAIEEGQLNRESYPFGKNKYQMPVSRNKKKALKMNQIEQIYNYKPEIECQDKARDLWIFSYLCNGINIKDLCLLKQKNIENEKISFRRAKTINTCKKDRTPIVASVNKEMKEIIRKWGKKSLDPEEYVFNILSKGDDLEEIHLKVNRTKSLINRNMKVIAKKLGIKENVTTYSARHSFATILRNANISTEYISEALGHTNLQMTANYLDSFEKEVVIKNQKKLLDFK